MRNVRISTIGVLRLLIPLVCLPAVFAQKGPVVVNAHTEGGEAVPGASVALTAPGAGTLRQAETGATGQARIDGVEPGRYQLTITRSGFDDLSTGLTVVPAGDNVIEAILSPIHNETITVQGVIDTPLEQANTSITLEREQVRNLPDRPRTVTDALPLSPGVVRLPTGELRLSGSGEHRSALLVNSGNAPPTRPQASSALRCPSTACGR